MRQGYGEGIEGVFKVKGFTLMRNGLRISIHDQYLYVLTGVKREVSRIVSW